MLYMPATTLATPVVFQETKPVPTTAQYYMLQPTSMVPTVPLLTTSFMYPAYAFVTKSTEKTDTTKSQIAEVTQPVQHVIHHHGSSCSVKTCPGYCDLCCPCGQKSRSRSRSRSTSSHRSRSRSRSPSPPTHDQHRHSRRDEFDRLKYDNKHETSGRSRSPSPRTHDQQRHSGRDEFHRSKYDNERETIDEKIKRIRHELKTTSFSTDHNSTETVDYYHPPRPRTPNVEYRVPYKQHYEPSPPAIEYRAPHKQHYDAPRPRSLSRSRSASSQRASSLSREPWRSSNQNDYPWRDSHLPAYREATLSRSQTPVDETRSWKETAHERSHSNTRNATTYYTNKDYTYRPKSENEARKWYTQSTGKNADSEVYHSLHGGTTTYTYTGSSTPCYDRHPSTNCHHSFYSDIPTTTKVHTLKQIDSTQHHKLYGCNEPCLHIVPKQGGTLDPPYLKILNAPVTYLH